MSPTGPATKGLASDAAVASREAPPADAPVAPRERLEDTTGAVVVALAQMAPRLGDVATNLDRHLTMIDEARRGEADLLVFPELSLTGYFLKDLVPEVAVRLDGPELEGIARAAGDLDVVVGCVLESDETRFHNSAIYISGGAIRHVHRKVYLPTYGLFDEQRYLAAGDRFRAFELLLPRAGQPRRWRAGIVVCEDMWHPSAPALLARQGIDILICPSASPGRGIIQGAALGTALSYDWMTRTFAQLFTTYLAYCNRTGYEDGVAFWGGSRVVGPDGSLLSEPGGAGEALMWHRLDLATLRRVRIAYPLLRDENHELNDRESDRIRSRRAQD